MVVPSKARFGGVKFQRVCSLTFGLFVQGCLPAGPDGVLATFTSRHATSQAAFSARCRTPRAQRGIVNILKPCGFMAVLAAFSLLVAALVLLDQNALHAGLWLLMIVSVTVGFGHGALDAHLLWRRFPSRPQALTLAAAYLLVVVLSGWALSHAVSVALWLLLGLSAWHFGEAYARWDNLHPATRTLTRFVVGGAPVMLPMWLSPGAMADLLRAALARQ